MMKDSVFIHKIGKVRANFANKFFAILHNVFLLMFI